MNRFDVVAHRDHFAVYDIDLNKIAPFCLKSSAALAAEKLNAYPDDVKLWNWITPRAELLKGGAK